MTCPRNYGIYTVLGDSDQLVSNGQGGSTGMILQLPVGAPPAALDIRGYMHLCRYRPGTCFLPNRKTPARRTQGQVALQAPSQYPWARLPLTAKVAFHRNPKTAGGDVKSLPLQVTSLWCDEYLNVTVHVLDELLEAFRDNIIQPDPAGYHPLVSWILAWRRGQPSSEWQVMNKPWPSRSRTSLKS